MCIESDIAHDYAEIYTPSREKLPWDKSNKPPTPPLHRFPSWESRIYQVANEGLTAVPASSQAEPPTGAAAHPARVQVTSQGYCDISVPVYATVKGVSKTSFFSFSSSCVFLFIQFFFRELVKSGPVRSPAIRRTIPATAKESTRTLPTRTASPPESRTAVAPTTRTRRCPVPAPARATRPRRRSRR